MPPAQVARGMARRLAPDEDTDAPPGWLRAEQIRSFRRVIHALRRFNGAVLADPVGSGKTYVALGVAAALNQGHATACLVPAALAEQWRSTARGLGVEVVMGSHQAASRGRLPPVGRGLVLIDEAHHYRNPGTWRYRHIAPWLVGRPVLLVTATPVVNRLEDLLHELLLGVRDDALAPDGVASLTALLAGEGGSPALGRLVVQAPDTEARGRPTRRGSASTPGPAECEAAESALAAIDRLRLSRLPAIEALIRAVLRRAVASSPAALCAALRHYRHLLLHARDAAGAGRPFSRDAIRRFTGELESQLVWWELMPDAQDPNDLQLDDLDRIDEVLREASLAEARADGKVERLRSLLRDGRPTLVFTSRRETVRYLRDRLGPPAVAWCTGSRAGVGRCPMPRSSVLRWFRNGNNGVAISSVRHLVVTDVAAEGLDLQRAARVVHYDLPWTPMRLEQREGRALRLGSAHREVEVVVFRPPSAIEHALRITQRLSLKARLPAVAGLGAAGRGLWRWRSELADAYSTGEATAGSAVVTSPRSGMLAAFELFGVGGCQQRLAAALVWIEPDGSWTEEEGIVAARLAEAATAAGAPPDGRRLREALALLAPPVRCRVAIARSSRWLAPQAASVPHQISLRLHQAIREAARRRDVESLTGLERALAFVGRGHTAGEAMTLERLSALQNGEFTRTALRLPPAGSRWDAIEVRLGGVLLFGPG